MVIWASAATAAAVILIVILILYRRQVRKTGRQLEFLKDRRTNLRLTSDLPLKEFNELIDGINEVIDQSREVRESAQHNEMQLKETITNLSHDIRTPLTSLDGYFQLLQHRLRLWTDISSFSSRAVRKKNGENMWGSSSRVFPV